ncbi:polysaccharide biosynthesis tyrosine autokinase [Rhodopseudomonas sp. P2A-2r]|uniref:polysaccharide biosynthesis tyrosine autokinase n=1 Tax=Rhodopseudomonas sp. P2A-2r TaxID=2991972 RepID=UPI0022345B55|nr:polysaccharide biosynthesis tyrosine autokinase [Rhodopseudomonas sp. P2A-2r]UZE50804.1 polysaccharide biosynthesis tyrosine autokinase [Rhodopseudomonas sp. P2A-2r]
MDATDSNETREPGLVQRIWQRRGLVAAVLGGVLVLTVIALLVLPVRYLATGSVIVAEQELGNNSTSAAWAQKIGDPADLESQLLVIRSPRVMRLAMALPGVLDAAVADCRAARGGSICDRMQTDSADFVDYVQNRYAIGAVGRSRVINISYQSSIPEVAQTMANALTNAFLEDQRAAGSNSREVAASWLRKELAQLDTQLRDADAKIQAFRRNKGLARGATAPISSERLTSISQQLSVAEAARADAAARLQEIKANQSRGASDAPSVLSSRAVADLKQQLTVVSAQLASQSNVLGPRHPALRALERERDLVQQRLTAEIASIAASAQKTYDANDALVTSLRKQVDAVKAEVGSATTDEASIESMVRDTEIKRQQYAELYKRTSELETERRVLLGSTRLVSLAELPNKPFFPKKIPFLAAGGTIGLLLALAAVLFGDRLKPAAAWLPTRPALPRKAAPVAATPAVAVAPPAAASAIAAPAKPAAPLPAIPAPAAAPPLSPAAAPTPPPVTAAVAKPVATPVERATELSVVTGASILARLPVIANDVPESPISAILAGQSGLSLVRSLSVAQQDPAYQAALRDLAAGLAVGAKAGACQKILMTAPGAGEGKTFLTLALAQHLAIAGRKVLAVECDLRTPRFEAALALAGGRGLQAVLLGDAQPGDVVVRTSIPNLDVIAAGPASSQFDLLRRRQMSDLLLWSQSYEVVLVDGPIPAVLMDVGVLARQVDGVLLSMRAGSFSIGEAVATTSAIKAAGGKVLGIAMTMMKPDASARPAEPAVDAYLRAT